MKDTPTQATLRKEIEDLHSNIQSMQNRLAGLVTAMSIVTLDREKILSTRRKARGRKDIQDVP